MVANLTVGRKGFEEVEEEMKQITQEASDYREKFLKDIDKDANAFNKVMDAFKLPKNIQEEFKNATLVPLEVAKDAVKLMEFASKVVEKGNKNAISDGAVAAMMARTAVLGALYNVKINLQSIKDEDFVSRISQKVHELESKAIEEEKKILSNVGL